MTTQLNDLLPLAIRAAEEASKVILEVYHSGDFQAESKGDNSPLTRADKVAHQAIEDVLKETQLPILSEEGRSIPYKERKAWDMFWMIDPLDGTKEFLKRNGDFTVNIALILKQKPVLGVVAIPVTNEVFYARQGGGVWLKNHAGELKLPGRKSQSLNVENLRVVASRSHMNEETERFIKDLRNPRLVSRGSSLKFMLMVQNEADIYPRFAPTMEWDTAAAHAIVNEAGLHVYQSNTNKELFYNKRDLLNPYFLVQ